LFVPKADGTRRWCMDMRPVNNATIADKNKAPLQDISRERLQGAKYFTRLDMRDGYHHLRIRKGDEKHTAFITEYGLYEWTVACFGLRNAPAEFARFMNDILMEYLNDFVVVYFDDIVIFSRTEGEHWKHVKKVLQKLKEAKINLKAKKCEFTVQETSFLRHIVNGDETKAERHFGMANSDNTETYKINRLLQVLHQRIYRPVKSSKQEVKRKEVFMVERR
jgi:reverse transcriptase-like protein